MDNAKLRKLLAMQTDQGAFPSYVTSDTGTTLDESCFVTASVTLHLLEFERAAKGSFQLFSAIQHALTFIESCASYTQPGAFHFYPPNRDTARVLPEIRADADDTALAWMAMLKGGIKTKSEARKTLPALFETIRTRARARGDAHWTNSGVYRTWFDSKSPDNPVDICVNANIATCLKMAGVSTEATFGSTADAINAILKKIIPTRQSMRLLAPYYAHPVELEIALKRAVLAGVVELKPALTAIQAYGLETQDIKDARPADRPFYCNAHGRPVWRAPALQLARSLSDPVLDTNPIPVSVTQKLPEISHDLFAEISSS